MKKTILTTLLIASIAISGLFADVALNNSDATSNENDMKITLNTSVASVDYNFRLVKGAETANSATLITLAKDATSNTIIENSNINILEADTVGKFGLVIEKGNMNSDMQFKIAIKPSTFVSTTPATNTDKGPTPVVTDKTDSDSTFTAKIGEASAFYTTETYTPGLVKDKLVASFSLDWATGTPNIRPDSYQSITSLAITVL